MRGDSNDFFPDTYYTIQPIAGVFTYMWIQWTQLEVELMSNFSFQATADYDTQTYFTDTKEKQMWWVIITHILNEQGILEKI